MFLTDFTVLRLITTIYHRISEISYICEFSAQVSEISFLADLMVLRLIKAV